MKLLGLVLLLSLLYFVNAQQANCSSLNSSYVLQYSWVPDGYCPFIFASNLSNPRGILAVENGDILVVEEGLNQVTVLYDEDEDGLSIGEWERATLAQASGLNHGVEVNNGYLYASSPTQVFRWKYTPGMRNNLGTGQLIIDNIPCCHHVTRTLRFDASGLFYVQSGSGSNVDNNSTHAQIRTFNFANFPNFPINWTQGNLFASGLRNEAGLRFDADDVLWGVENGVDNLERTDLGGDIHDNNPSEEMNLFTEPGNFYGYPYCWSQFKLSTVNTPPGTQYVHPNFMNDGIHSDAWCQNKSNVLPPVYNFQAHMAPLDILFWNEDVFPNMTGGAFVSFHGSWDRQPKVGYRVDYVEFNQNRVPVNNYPFLRYIGPGATGTHWPHQPVGLAASNCLFGTCLLISSDSSGVIIGVGYSDE